mgnify:FL=1
MATGKFDGEAFFAALDAQRAAKRLTWKKVAEQAGVPASTLTRMSQGKRPDIDSLASLCGWSGLRAEDFYKDAPGITTRPEPLAEMATLFRGDHRLTKEGAAALETLLRTAYERFRIDKG